MSPYSEPDQGKLASVMAQFHMGGRFLSASRIGSGHINDSWLIETSPETAPDYVLQRINSRVFRNIPALMDNILRVTRHLEQKILSGIPEAASFKVLHLVPSKSGYFYIEDGECNFWRCYNHVKGTKSYDIPEDPLMAYEGGRAFGLFQLLTSDIPGNLLAETIPWFHHIGKRLAAFHEVVSKDTAGRVKDAAWEISFIREREIEMMKIQALLDEGRIPVRVTHNDTKFNNILFNENKKAICIVDLDTVMPGTVLFDFGDAVRTGANAGAEDEKDLKKVFIDMDLYKAYTKGYLEAAGKFLLKEENENLAFSARFMTYIIGLRFLTDHIDGDHYYRIHFENHNLQRARAQFRLLETMEDMAGEMERIVREVSGEQVNKRTGDQVI
jgi:hypothetical protein